jgi:cellobiose-specific phosphotransferase system component IIC
VVKKDGVWKAASIHFSTNVLDNAILNRVRDMLWWIGGGGVLLGLVIGWLIGKRRRRPA